jgi:hypothetical protein
MSNLYEVCGARAATTFHTYGHHVCTLPSRHGPDHRCGCGFTWVNVRPPKAVPAPTSVVPTPGHAADVSCPGTDCSSLIDVGRYVEALVDADGKCAAETGGHAMILAALIAVRYGESLESFVNNAESIYRQARDIQVQTN